MWQGKAFQHIRRQYDIWTGAPPGPPVQRDLWPSGNAGGNGPFRICKIFLHPFIRLSWEQSDRSGRDQGDGKPDSPGKTLQDSGDRFRPGRNDLPYSSIAQRLFLWILLYRYCAYPGQTRAKTIPGLWFHYLPGPGYWTGSGNPGIWAINLWSGHGPGCYSCGPGHWYCAGLCGKAVKTQWKIFAFRPGGKATDSGFFVWPHWRVVAIWRCLSDWFSHH